MDATKSSASRRVINTENAPPPVGPYSHSVASSGLLFVAGQMGIDPAKGALAEGGIEAQTRQALKNLAAIVEEAGATMSDVVKTTVFMIDFDQFQVMNGVYAEFFNGSPPARSAFQVSRLPMGAIVEIEAIVAVD